jgi:hypothetical protein
MAEQPPVLGVNWDFHGDIVALEKLRGFYSGNRPPALDNAENAILSVIGAKAHYVALKVSQVVDAASFSAGIAGAKQ